MFKWIGKLFPDQNKLMNMSCSSGLSYYMKEAAIWHFDCESVARGVAAGLFIAVIPILPFQTLLLIVLCLILRANFPIAFIVSWVSNPITLLPLAYLTYYIGELILGVENTVIIHQVDWNWSSIYTFLASSAVWFTQFGKAFFVGLPFLAFGLAISGYCITLVICMLNHLFHRYRIKNK